VRRASCVDRTPVAHPIEVHENDVAQHTAVIDARFTMASWERTAADGSFVRLSASTDRSSPVSLQSLNQISVIKLISPEPRASLSVLSVLKKYNCKKNQIFIGFKIFWKREEEPIKSRMLYQLSYRFTCTLATPQPMMASTSSFGKKQAFVPIRLTTRHLAPWPPARKEAMGATSCMS